MPRDWKYARYENGHPKPVGSISLKVGAQKLPIFKWFDDMAT